MTTTYVIGSNGKPTIDKRVGATLDYSFDWSPWLTALNDTINTVVWTVSAGLTKTSSSNSTTAALANISGGALGTIESVTCKITTNSTPARVDERTIYLNIVK